MVLWSLLIGFCVGLLIGRMLCVKIIYHGPNAKETSKKIHRDEVTGKCYKFVPKMFICPD
jgi:hypothetical protein